MCAKIEGKSIHAANMTHAIKILLIISWKQKQENQYHRQARSRPITYNERNLGESSWLNHFIRSDDLIVEKAWQKASLKCIAY